MGISTVAVYADSDSLSPHVREADVAVSLEGITASETYLHIQKIITSAQRAGADAVHPGYGFLSERGDFAQSVVDAGLIWIGPSPESIRLMGNKLEAKRLLTDAKVPMLPAADLTGLAPAQAMSRAHEIGFPVLVKAAGGGGGRGMRIVHDPERLLEHLESASREAERAFGDGTIFLEPYLQSSRHVEIQVFGDCHGNLVHLFERECSIQRRHQKIIEEAPSAAVGPDLRERMGSAAVAAAQAVSYQGAGTVEFLLDDDGRFYFLEMNTRLQVEHPVTEAITGRDLVREQIRVAEGEPLSFTQDDLEINGHAIEARLYAEDVASGFLPTAGTVAVWQPDPLLPVRIDSGVESGSSISVHFDPMLAKVIAHAPTRMEASLALALALQRMRIHGLTTNRDFLVNILRHEAFLAGDTRTDFIERKAPGHTAQLDPTAVENSALAAALYGQHLRRKGAATLGTHPSGWRNAPSQFQWAMFRFAGADIRVNYMRVRGTSDVFRFEVGERDGTARTAMIAPDRMSLEINGVARDFVFTQSGQNTYVHTSEGEVALVEQERFPETEREVGTGGYSAPMPSRVVQVNITVGSSVKRGELLATLEAMKMEHRILAADDGVVSAVYVTVGQQIDRGHVLLEIHSSDSK